MEGTTLRWKATTAALPGFLLTVLLLSAVSALKCQRSTSIVHCNSEGKERFGLDTGSSNITCSADEDTCVQVKLELIADGTVVLVSHRDCARKDLNNREGSTTTGDRNFAIQSNVSYCLYDLCNVEMASENAPKTLVGGKAEARGSLECYSGLNFDPTEPFLERVKCSKGYNQCYQGEGMITTGLLTIPMYIRTCQRPSCAVPQSQSFGPITITSEGGSCCTGSYCNAKEVESQAQKNHFSVPANGSHGEGAVNHTANFTEPHVEGGISIPSPVPGTGSVTPGRSWETSPLTTTPYSNDVFDETGDSYGDDESPPPLLIPQIHDSGPKGPTLQRCPLLVALGITVLEIRW